MSRHVQATNCRFVGGHDAYVEKITGPGAVKMRTARCSCGWQGETHCRADGITGLTKSIDERDTHLADATGTLR